MSDPTIRPATSADLPAVAAIVAAAYGRWIPQIGRKPGPMLDDYAARIASGAVFALDVDQSVEGLIVLVAEPECLLLDNVAVRPEAQGRGYGRLLLEFAERWARAAGLSCIRLYTHERMAENIALYERAGYAETHRAIDQDLPRVFMTKTL